MKATFVDKLVRSYEGDEAHKKLESCNDRRFQSSWGILQVDQSRWEDAQEYELRTWMDLNPHASDDHNRQNAENLNNYESIKDKTFQNVIEVGCGPFTNLRLILSRIKAEKITLLDPLIESYIAHQNCTYKNKVLNGYPVTCIKSSIEDFKFELEYDLLVMINVLPHCRDAVHVLENVRDMIVPGGIIVFLEAGCFPNTSSFLYDAGHPCLVQPEIIEAFKEKFTVMYQKEFPGESTVIDKYIAFIGKK